MDELKSFGFLWFIVLFVALVTAGPARATINIDVNGVQKAVVFLYATMANGEVDKSRPVGTGFLVGVPLKSAADKVYPVLITARHMFDPIWAQCGGTNPERIFVRINKKDSGPTPSPNSIVFIPIQLTNESRPTWHHHQDEDVDAAAISFSVPQSEVDALLIPLEMFPTKAESAAQSIGDPVMSAGLLPNLPGNPRNYPIFKFGHISNIPAEDVETRCFEKGPTFRVRVWLIAANLVPGNSGSPIFHVPLGGSGVSFGGTRPMLLGVQSMSFPGADVAGMTPINYVYEILQVMLPDGNFERTVPKQAPE